MYYNKPMRVSATPSWQAGDNPKANNPKDWQKTESGTGATQQGPRRRLSRKATRRIVSQQSKPITTVSGQDGYHLGQAGRSGGHCGYGR